MGHKTVRETFGIEEHHLVHIRDGKLCIGAEYVPEALMFSLETGESLRENLGGFSSFDTYLLRMADPIAVKAAIATPDVFDRSITVYTFDGGEIIEKQCETLGWPNVTHDGYLMFANTFSDDREKVKRWALEEAQCGIRIGHRLIRDTRSQLALHQQYLDDHKQAVAQLCQS